MSTVSSPLQNETRPRTIEPHRDGPRFIGALLRVPANAFQRRIAEALQQRWPELRPAHMVVFQHLDHPPGGTRLTDLAERAQLSKQALIEVVDFMEKHGHVERIPDPTDRRAKLLRMTGKGWAVHEGATDIGRGIQAEWAALLGEARFSAMAESLRTLGDLLEADAKHG